MKKIICLTFLAATLAGFGLGGCSYKNLEETKANSPWTWEQAGYKIIGYEGFEWGIGFGDYGGAKVWHTLRRDAAPGIIYSGYVQRWGNEYHIYGPKAVDALKGS